MLVFSLAKAQNFFPPSGNVGVGTGSSPSFPLHIYRNVATTNSMFVLQDNYASGVTHMGFLGTGPNNFFYLGVGNHLNTSLGGIFQNKFYIANSSFTATRFSIDASGTVNIGSAVASGGGKLAVYSTATNTSGLQLVNLNSSSAATTGSGKFLAVDATGNVVLNNGTINGWTFTGNSGTNPTSNFIGTTDNFDLAFRSNNVERLRILSNGNITFGTGTDNGKLLQVFGAGFVSGSLGIGTTLISDANFDLFVSKGVRTRKVKVDIDTWPDYVFESGYRLMNLGELEKYIIRNKHLPNVPAASEVRREGLDLGNTQTQLLEKIEELTLYIIQQNRITESLSKEVLVLKEQLHELKIAWNSCEMKLSSNYLSKSCECLPD